MYDIRPKRVWKLFFSLLYQIISSLVSRLRESRPHLSEPFSQSLNLLLLLGNVEPNEKDMSLLCRLVLRQVQPEVTARLTPATFLTKTDSPQGRTPNSEQS